jgi:hypothetical protein
MKAGYTKKARQCDVNKAKAILHSHQVKCRFLKNKTDGYADFGIDTVYIGTDVSIQYFWSLVFHELAHILNRRNRKYFRYHRDFCHKEVVKKLGLRAERYTDKVAAKEMKKYKFGFRFLPRYAHPWQIQWYRAKMKDYLG